MIRSREIASSKSVAGLAAAALSIMAAAAAPAPAQKGLALPPKLRGALVTEMSGVRQGVSEIAASLGSGDWEMVARRADRIRDSYLLKQALTNAELATLERNLPRDFLERDASFHARADGLARAARAKDYELAVFYFSRMLEGCYGCHTRYAADALSGFRPLK